MLQRDASVGDPALLAHPWGCNMGPYRSSGSIAGSRERFPPEGCHSRCPLAPGCCFTSFPLSLPPSFPFVYIIIPSTPRRGWFMCGENDY